MVWNLIPMCRLSCLLILTCVYAAEESSLASKWEINTPNPNPWQMSFDASTNNVVIKTMRSNSRILCKLKNANSEQPWRISYATSWVHNAAWFQFQADNDWKCCMFKLPMKNETIAVDESECLFVSKRNASDQPESNPANATVVPDFEDQTSCSDIVMVVIVTMIITALCTAAAIFGIFILRKRYQKRTVSTQNNTYDVALPNIDAPRPKAAVQEDRYGYLVKSPVPSRETCGYVDIQPPTPSDDDDGYGNLLAMHQNNSKAGGRGDSSAIYENVSPPCRR